MKILNNKKQNELFEKVKELNSLIVKSNIDIKAFDLLADIGCLVLDMRHLFKLKNELIKELKIKEKLEDDK